METHYFLVLSKIIHYVNNTAMVPLIVLYYFKKLRKQWFCYFITRNQRKVIFQATITRKF